MVDWMEEMQVGARSGTSDGGGIPGGGRGPYPERVVKDGEGREERQKEVTKKGRQKE